MITELDVDNYFKRIGEIGNVDEYLGTTADYFRDNLKSIERFVKKSKSKKFKLKTGMSSDKALSMFIFEKDGVSSMAGTPLSEECIRQYLKNTRAEARRGEVVFQPSHKPLEASETVEVVVKPQPAEKKPSRVVSVSSVASPVFSSVAAAAPAVEDAAPSSGEIDFLRPGKKWKPEDYKAASEQMKAKGYNFAWYEDKATALYQSYAKDFDVGKIEWNEEAVLLWVYSKGEYPRLFENTYFTREHSFKNGLKFGKFWDFLKKISPFA